MGNIPSLRREEIMTNSKNNIRMEKIVWQDSIYSDYKWELQVNSVQDKELFKEFDKEEKCSMNFFNLYIQKDEVQDRIKKIPLSHREMSIRSVKIHMEEKLKGK